MKDHAEQLVQALERLSSTLASSGKSETAAFFSQLRERVRDAKDKEAVQTIADEIGRMAAIAQYAEFNGQEERLLNDVQKTAFLFGKG